MNLLSSQVNQTEKPAITMNINPNVFIVPVDLCYEATRASQISLLIRLANPRRQNLRALVLFPWLWGMDNTVTGRVVDHGRAQFMFPSNEALQLVLRRGPWSFSEWMVAMEPWSPNITNECPTTVDFWVEIRDIPLQFLSAALVRFIAESLGHIVEFDEAAMGGNAVFQLVCIRWPLDVTLVFMREF
ncbi:hypothetical protein V5N11_012830 [Cardamine amara subsp. amara]|uniref:DUF4283 domain-containing protein n=1 Tax=Cardamine amara subsp. amara TaxID=228776 RepID=A0ABD1BAY6_CARAN